MIEVGVPDFRLGGIPRFIYLSLSLSSGFIGVNVPFIFSRDYTKHFI
jgi:hypothetical protein